MRKQRSSEYRGFRRAGIRLSEEVLPDVEGPQRDTLPGVMGELNRLRHAALTLAAQHVETVMSDYPFGQPAQPITLGHQLPARGSAHQAESRRRALEAAYQAARRHVDEARAKLESAVDALVGETG